MKLILTAALVAAFLTHSGVAQNAEEMSPCDQLVALFIELAERSGETVTEAEARTEVMAENLTDAECAAMQALFAGQQ